jgi:hypothetical protein
MSFIKFNPRTALLLIFITAIAMVRVVTNLDEKFLPLKNFSPVGAMALFGGAYFSTKSKAFAFPLLMLFISDFILRQTAFKDYDSGILYDGWYWVYGAFALMTIAGGWLLKKITVKTFILSTLVCVFIHWIVTDFGVWYHSRIFSQDVQGYIDCLIVAIPYECRFLTGTIIYGIILFAVFEWMQQRYTVLKTSR